jgi:hypothetical protein
MTKMGELIKKKEKLLLLKTGALALIAAVSFLGNWKYLVYRRRSA